MIVYKLTDKDGYCRRHMPGETLYQIGMIYLADGNGILCTRHWRHAYEHPILAILHNCIHGRYGNTARLWMCDTLDGVVKRDGQMKLGTTKLEILREIKKPKVTLEQRVAYAISCSLRLYAEESYVEWAENWLSGKDRSRKSANKASIAAREPAAVHAALAAMRMTAATSPSSRSAYAAEAASVDETFDLLDCAKEVYLID